MVKLGGGPFACYLKARLAVGRFRLARSQKCGYDWGYSSSYRSD